MKEVYRKHGIVTRVENGWVVHVHESGIAIEEDGVFTCEPSPSQWSGGRPRPPLIDVSAAEAAAAPLRVERAIATAGVAEHEFEGHVWTDAVQRIHLSIIKEKLRVLIDDEADVESVMQSLARAEVVEREAPRELRLAPSVSAALLPFASGLVELWQGGGGIDGKGQPIEECPIVKPPWPNWYRPSYRTRPVRVPMNLRAVGASTDVDRDLPIAVALLAPVSGLELRVLVDDGARVYPSRVHVTRIRAVASETKWYPYGAGSFGAEMML